MSFFETSSSILPKLIILINDVSNQGHITMTSPRKSPLMTTAEAAAWLRIKPHTLENMRWRGTGPKFRKHGGRVLYHREEIKAWSGAMQRQSTSGNTE